MKTNNLVKAVLMVMIAGSLWSCSKGKSDSNPYYPPAATSTDVTNPGNGYNSYNWPNDGSVAVFNPVSLGVMNSWVGLHPLNAPTNFRIRVQLQKVYAGNVGPYYYGYVSIGYTDNNTWYESYLYLNSSQNVSCSNCNDNGALEAKYNYFYKQSDGTIVFSGFFQDSYGSIILTLKPASGTGADAEGTVSYNGNVYYKNFAQSMNVQSAYRKCWFLTNGPYTCTSNAAMNKTSLTSFDGYQTLGSFTGLVKNKILVN